MGEIPATTQVVWVSRVRDRVGAKTWMEVVRLEDLEGFAAEQKKDPKRILQGLGLVKRGGGDAVDWKVTIFDVERTWMCRPVEAALAGSMMAAVAVCEDDQQKASVGARHGFTGCGYSLDTGAGTRGLDVFRVRWEDAAAQGFCVMPLARFVEGL